MYKLLFILLSFLLFTSCSKEIKVGDEGVNLFGGIGRTSSYENYGKFEGYVDELLVTSNDSSGIIQAPLPLSKSYAVLATAGGSILLTYNYSLLWEYKPDENILVTGGMAADKNANIYFPASNGSIYSISSTGEFKWSKNLVNIDEEIVLFSDLLTVKNGIITASNENIITMLDYDGNIKWKRESTYSATKNFAANSDANIALTLTQNRFGGNDSLLYISSENGDVLWSKEFNNFRFIKGSVIWDNKIYINGVREKPEGRISVIYVFDTEGNLLLEKEMFFVIRNLSVDLDGNIYTVGYNAGLGEAMSGIFCLKPDGTVKWQIFFQTTSVAPALISEKSVVMLGSNRKGVGLYFINKETGVLIETISLSNVPVVLLEASVNTNCDILFGIADRAGVVKVGKSPIGKLIPL